MLWFIDTALLALAAIATRFLLRIAREAEAKAKLTEAGLQVVRGDLLGTFVVRLLEGVEVVLTNRMPQTRPGASEPIGATCVARVAVPLVDQIVCKTSEAALVMGPLPSAPRIHTGFASFDHGYAVFVGSAGGAEGGSYRAAPMASDVPWAQVPVLARLQELDLLWMRVHDGYADLVFPPLDIEGVVRAVALAVAVAYAAAGLSIPTLTHRPRTALPPSKGVRDRIKLVWVLGANPATLTLLLFSTLRAQEAKPPAYGPSWCLLAMSVVVLVGLLITALRLRPVLRASDGA